jgi:hypothetical protein
MGSVHSSETGDQDSVHPEDSDIYQAGQSVRIADTASDIYSHPSRSVVSIDTGDVLPLLQGLDSPRSSIDLTFAMPPGAIAIMDGASDYPYAQQQPRAPPGLPAHWSATNGVYDIHGQAVGGEDAHGRPYNPHLNDVVNGRASDIFETQMHPLRPVDMSTQTVDPYGYMTVGYPIGEALSYTTTPDRHHATANGDHAEGGNGETHANMGNGHALNHSVTPQPAPGDNAAALLRLLTNPAPPAPTTNSRPTVSLPPTANGNPRARPFAARASTTSLVPHRRLDLDDDRRTDELATGFTPNHFGEQQEPRGRASSRTGNFPSVPAGPSRLPIPAQRDLSGMPEPLRRSVSRHGPELNGRLQGGFSPSRLPSRVQTPASISPERFDVPAPVNSYTTSIADTNDATANGPVSSMHDVVRDFLPLEQAVTSSSGTSDPPPHISPSIEFAGLAGEARSHANGSADDLQRGRLRVRNPDPISRESSPPTSNTLAAIPGTSSTGKPFGLHCMTLTNRCRTSKILC